MAESLPQSIPYEKIEEAANYISTKVPTKPVVGIICELGIGKVFDVLEDKIDIPYEEIPACPVCNNEKHESTLSYGVLADTAIICFRDKFHYYDGCTTDYVAYPVRLLKLLGVAYIVITYAASTINKEYKSGDIMIFKDHVNFALFGRNKPLTVGDDSRVTPFSSVRYVKDIRNKAKEAFTKSSFDGEVHEGVYVCLGGPKCETSIAEIRMLRMCGADAVGMSTVYEILEAMYSGMHVLAMSLIIDECETEYDIDEKTVNDEVQSQMNPQAYKSFLENFIEIIKFEKKDENIYAGEETITEKKKVYPCTCKNNPNSTQKFLL